VPPQGDLRRDTSYPNLRFRCRLGEISTQAANRGKVADVQRVLLLGRRDGV
jgi:hypothetical protein